MMEPEERGEYLYETPEGFDVVAESTGKTEIARIPIKKIREYLARLDSKP